MKGIEQRTALLRSPWAVMPMSEVYLRLWYADAADGPPAGCCP
jgi:hypothetical protein